MSRYFASRSLPANTRGSKSKQFLKRVLPRSIAVLFATSALMLPVMIPAQVLVMDDATETSTASIDGEMGELLTDVVNDSSFGVPLVGTFNVASPARITDVASYAAQACGDTYAVVATVTLGELLLTDSPSPNTITLPTGDAGGADAGTICAQIIAYRAAAYNDSAAEVTQLFEYVMAAEKLQNQSISAITVGQSSAVTAQATSLLVDVQAQMAFWETRKESYQIAIQFLQEEQNTLTQNALRGNGGLATLFTGVVQAAVLDQTLKDIADNP